MLDMLNSHKVRNDSTGDVFDRANPAQTALRTLLESYSEFELAEIEQDLSYFASSGVMTSRIEALLCEADDDISNVA